MVNHISEKINEYIFKICIYCELFMKIAHLFPLMKKNCPSVNHQYDNANILIKLFSFTSHYKTINMYVYLFYDFILCYNL